MATATETDIDAAINAVLSRFKVKMALKSEQHLALKAFLQKRDVFLCSAHRVRQESFKRRQMQADLWL